MTKAFLFWVLMILWLIFGIVIPHSSALVTWATGGSLLEFILFALLGWQVFGKPVQ